MLSTGTIKPSYIAAADFNGDGKPDLAIPDPYGTAVAIYLNLGAGTFGAPVMTTFSIDATVGSLLAGDFNEDGKADLVVSGDEYSVVLLGNGDGTFAAQPAIPGSSNFLSGRVADFNGDKHADIFLGGNGSPYLFLGKGDGSFTQGTVGNAISGSFSGSAVADFNGDGHLDGVLAAYGDPTSALGQIEFFSGNGNGSLGNASMFQPTNMENPSALDAADFDGDGKVDLLVSASAGAFVCLGNGDGTFQFQTPEVIGEYPGYGMSFVTNPDTPNVLAADLDQDGTPDAIILEPELGRLTLLPNDGSGKFLNALKTPYSAVFAVGSYRASIADFNSDGLPDIVAVSRTAQTISLLLSKKGQGQPAVSISSSGNSLLLGTPITFKVGVSGSPQTPTGSVSLLDGGVKLGQQTLGANGITAFAVSNLAAGTHTITATYSGDANYAGASSSSVSQVVTDFQMTVTTGSQTVSPGKSANYSLTITPSAGLNATVDVSCSGLPAEATCQPSPSQISATTGVATIAVVVNTTAPTVASERAAGSFVLLCFCLWTPLRRRRGWVITATPLLFIVLSGCSGGG